MEVVILGFMEKQVKVNWGWFWRVVFLFFYYYLFDFGLKGWSGLGVGSGLVKWVVGFGKKYGLVVIEWALGLWIMDFGRFLC